MKALLRRLDRSWAAMLVLSGFLIWFLLWWWAEHSKGVLLTGEMPQSTRLTLYSTIAGVMAGLLGFVIAAIAILIALPRNVSERFRKVRRYVVELLLGTSFLLALSLGMAVLGMMVDDGVHAPVYLQAATLAFLATSALGLVIGGVGLWALFRSSD